jgi:hypothetical protein
LLKAIRELVRIKPTPSALSLGDKPSRVKRLDLGSRRCESPERATEKSDPLD